MKVKLLISLVLLAGVLSSSGARANLHCWMAGNVFAYFGEVRSGSSASMPLQADIQCDNTQTGNEKVRWARVCLTGDRQPTMHTNTTQDHLDYNIYQDNDLSTPIDKTHYASVDMQLAAAKSNQPIPISLTAKIVPGQQVPAGEYNDYSETVVHMQYDFNENRSSLQKCGSMSSEILDSRIAGKAIVVNGCELINVDPMNFGNKSPADGSQLEGSAVSGVTLRCPTNTTYTVAMDMGRNRSGSTRRMCNGNNECVSYGLYQDSSLSVPWDDSANTLTETSTTGQEQSIAVYGHVPPQTWPSAGEYDDTVVVTLSY